MIDIKQWLEMRINRRILLSVFPFVAVASLFYIIMGFVTSFLAISIVYGFIIILLALAGVIALVYTYIEDWAEKGRL